MQSLPRPESPETPITEFYNWAVSSLVPGVSGQYGTDARFLPLERLRAHLSEERLLELLEAVFKHMGNRHALKTLAYEINSKGCIAVFAILILIGRGNLIQIFTTSHYTLADFYLPFSETRPPVDFPSDQGVLQQFCKIQFQFCVRPLKNLNMHIPASHILPIRSMVLQDTGVTARVYRIEVDESLCEITLPGQIQDDRSLPPRSTIFAVKRFEGSKLGKQHFQKEIDAFQILGRVDNLIGYYGYFTVNGPEGAQDDPLSHNIVLEYADLGNLGAFWDNPRQPIPTSETAFVSFWSQIFGLAKALDAIHHVRPSGQDSEEAPLRGFHHDIRPANILVSTNDATGTSGDFPYRFMLGDLGLADFVRSTNASVTTDEPNGPLVYSSPEAYREHHSRTWPLRSSQAADIWSLGAIFSEALTWSTQGYAGLHKYRENRRRENPHKEPRFHDGIHRLRAIAEEHATCLSVTRIGAAIGPQIVQLLEDMLQAVPEKRPEAFRLYPRAERIVSSGGSHSRDNEFARRMPIPVQEDDSHDEDSHGLPSTRGLSRRETEPASLKSRSGSMSVPGAGSLGVVPSMREHRHSQRLVPSTANPRPRSRTSTVSVEPRPSQDAEPYYVSNGQLEVWKARKKSKQDPRMPLMDHLQELRNRDSVLVIDDSRTMYEHWSTLIKRLGLLACAIKEFDDDGMDYVFMSEGKVHHSKDSQPIVSATQLQRSRCTTKTNASITLNGLFKDYVERYQKSLASGKGSFGKNMLKTWINKPCKPCTFYIFTDAVWQPHCRVSEPVVWMLKQLANAPRRQVGISFIQFGNDELGTRRLKFLDNGLKRKYQVPDVIDYEYQDGNALKMLLGSVNDWWDGDDSDEDWLDD